jgi:regulatory protein|tara:strand:- start:2065 stop:2580 length:516 start_codon:yes stop_codon:yes gene_type:complete
VTNLLNSAIVADAGERDKTRAIALDLLGVRDRSVREMRQRLAKRGCATGDIDTVVTDLEALGLLDDHKFVSRWIETRRERRPEGVPKIMRDLLRRGVDKAVVEQVLSELEHDLGSREEALALLRRNSARYVGLEATKAQRRMYGLLARRGFDPETTRHAVERAWSEIEGED